MTHVYAGELTQREALVALENVLADVARKWPKYNTAHEGYAVLLEEVHELWGHVMTQQHARDLAHMRTEALQVAAVAIRFAVDVCTEERGRR